MKTREPIKSYGFQGVKVEPDAFNFHDHHQNWEISLFIQRDFANYWNMSN
jgi:hypothetical protein